MSLVDRIKAAGGDPVRSWLNGLMANSQLGLATLLRPPRPGTQPIRRDYARLRVAAVVAVAVIALTMLFVDGPVAQAATHWPSWMFSVFSYISDFGKSGWFLFPIGFALLVIAAVAQPGWLSQRSLLVLSALSTRLGFLFCAIGAPSLFATIIKRLIGRARPHVGDAADPFHFVHFVWRSDFASMPSGHATTAFAAAVAFGVLWPRLRPFLLVYAVAVAVSRIVLHAHFVSDVTAGAIVGILGALLVRDWFAVRHLGFAVDRDGLVHALPGPSITRIKRVARERMAS